MSRIAAGGRRDQALSSVTEPLGTFSHESPTQGPLTTGGNGQAMSGGADGPSAAAIDAAAAYVDVVAELVQMTLSEERRIAVAAVMARIAGFAAHVRDFALTDDVEIAGIFTP